MLNILLAGSVLIMVITTPVYASQHVEYPENSADVLVTSFLGEFDPREPGEPPPVDEWWLDVTVPTLTAFYSNQTGTPEHLESPNYDVINHSYMGLLVHVEGFTVRSDVNGLPLQEGLDLIQGLDIVQVGESSGIPLVRHGEVVDMSLAVVPPLFALDGHTGSRDVGWFEYVGLAPTVAAVTAIQRPEFNLLFRFEVATVTHFSIEMMAAHADISGMMENDVASLLGVPALQRLFLARNSTGGSETEIAVTGTLEADASTELAPAPPRQVRPPITGQPEPLEPEGGGTLEPENNRVGARVLPQTGARLMKTSLIGSLVLMIGGLSIAVKRKK